ncbi:MAG: AsmA-like C-terminal region-containing protein [Myxococcota bacterium]|nr:AsmA-like C-terminal region-containing protein [Myxococcota bacterium]
MRSRLLRFIAAAALLGTAVFVLADRYGGELLRSEAETQLGRWLGSRVSVSGVELSLSDGLGFVAHEVATYPRASGGNGLASARLSLNVDGFSLLTGRLQFSSLRLEGAHLEIRSEPGGGWSPFELLGRHEQPVGSTSSSEDLESTVAPIRFLDRAAHFLLGDSFAIDSLEIRGSSVRFVDSQRPGSPGILFDDLDVRLVRDPVTNVRRLEIHSLGSANGEEDFPLRVEAIRKPGTEIEVVASLSNFPLAPFVQLVSDPDAGTEAAGSVDVEFSYRTSSPGSGTLDIEAVARDLAVSVPLRAEPLEIESPELRLESRLRLDPRHLELFETSISGLAHQGKLLMAGSAGRPLRESTRVRFSVELRGAGRDQLKQIISWLPRSDADPLERILERVTAGRIPSIGASGRIRLSEWKALLRGQLTALPSPFVLAAKIKDLAIGSEFNNRLTDITGHVEWSEDQIELRRIRARWNGEALPVLDFHAEGVSNLFKGPEELRWLTEPAPELPGIEPLLSWFEELTAEKNPPPDPLPSVRILLDHLEHPGLRWPLRKAVLRFIPVTDGAEWIVESGNWAGAHIDGEIVSVESPEERWIASLRIRPAGAPPLASEVPHPSGEWAHGRIETESLVGIGLPIEAVNADFSFQKSTLVVEGLETRTPPSGSIRANAELDLGHPEWADFSIHADLRNGSLEPIARIAGLGPDFGEGALDADLELRGKIAPQQTILENSRGKLSLSARDGEIAYAVPVALAVAQATIGFNPFASRESTRYDSIEVDFELEPGRVKTQNFELDGPLRVFAAGELDIVSEPPRIDAVVGIFLLRQFDRILGKVPVLSNLISDKGLVGSYFEVEGPLESPRVESLPAASLAEAVPQFIRLPFEALGSIPDKEERSSQSGSRARGGARERAPARSEGKSTP